MLRLFMIVVGLQLCSCENSSFDKDKRQIAAKNEIMARVPGPSSGFDITGFREDTVPASNCNSFEEVIRYTLHFTYKDSSGVLQQKTGQVLFAPDGKSVLGASITGLNP